MFIFVLPFLKQKKTAFLEYDFLVTHLFEAFSSYITISFFSAFLLLIPFIIYNTLSFFCAGLFLYERKFLKLLFLSCVLSIIIAFLCLYFLFLPLILNFFLNSFELTSGRLFFLKFEQKLIDYVYLIVYLDIFFALFFQIVFLAIYLVKSNFVNILFLKNNRRFFILFFFILGFFFSPPDVYSLLIITTPLIFCFEGIIYILETRKFYSFNKWSKKV